MALFLASALNRRAMVVEPATGTRLKVWTRFKVVIGSANFSSLKLSFPATIFTTDDVAVGNNYTIDLCAFERESGGAAFTPVLFSGVRSAVVTNGLTEFLSDDILPASFGAATFNRGDVYWVRCLLSLSSAGQNIPVCQAAIMGTGGVTLFHDPVTTGVSSVDGTGAPGYGTGTGGTGPTDFNFGAGFCPVVLGVPTSTALHFAGLGDSIVNGTGETVGGGSGWYRGIFTRSLADSSFTSNVFSGINFGWPGGNADQWNLTLLASKKLLTYANVTVEEYGTNGAQYANSSAIWAMSRGLGHQVIRTKLATITTSTDGWATKANQTKLAGWTTPGGAQAVFNTQIAAQESVLFDKFANFDAAILDGLDRDYWLSPGYTTDGTHPTSLAHEAMAAVLRTTIASLAAPSGPTFPSASSKRFTSQRHSFGLSR